MHEDTGTEAMLTARDFAKPWPQWGRVIVRAVLVALCMVLMLGGAFGMIYVAQNWPQTGACVLAVVVLLLIGYVWDEESKIW